MACGDGPSKGIVHSQAWSYSSVTGNRELARQHARRREKHVSFQRLAVVRGSSPVLGPPVLDPEPTPATAFDLDQKIPQRQTPNSSARPSNHCPSFGLIQRSNRLA